MKLLRLTPHLDLLFSLFTSRTVFGLRVADEQESKLWEDLLAEGFDTWVVGNEVRFFTPDPNGGKDIWLTMVILTDGHVRMVPSVRNQRIAVPVKIFRTFEKHGYHITRDCIPREVGQ